LTTVLEKIADLEAALEKRTLDDKESNAVARAVARLVLADDP